jgi:signal transduction histidine kinase
VTALYLLFNYLLKCKTNGISERESARRKFPTILYYQTGRTLNRIRLSLSYDIIKAHGGELEVETKEGEFAEFILKLPE